MAQVTGTYQFGRAGGIVGFARPNRIGTDAVNALVEWTAKNDQRCYVVTDSRPEECFVAQLSWSDGENGHALDQLRACCTKHGVVLKPFEANADSGRPTQPGLPDSLSPIVAH